MNKIKEDIEWICKRYPDRDTMGMTMDLLAYRLEKEGWDSNSAFELFKTLPSDDQKKLVALLDEILSCNPDALETGMEHWSTIGGNYPYGHVSIKPIGARWIQVLARLRDSTKAGA